jgi:hypothetical protein
MRGLARCLFQNFKMKNDNGWWKVESGGHPAPAEAGTWLTALPLSSGQQNAPLSFRSNSPTKAHLRVPHNGR